MCEKGNNKKKLEMTEEDYKRMFTEGRAYEYD